MLVALGDAAGIGVLDDRDRGGALGIELGDAFIGRVGVVEIVVGELLALHLPRAWRRRARCSPATIERRLLVRVLAVAQRFRQLAAEGAERRRVVAKLVARTSSRSRRHRRRCAHRPWRRASCAAPSVVPLCCLQLVEHRARSRPRRPRPRRRRGSWRRRGSSRGRRCRCSRCRSSKSAPFATVSSNG